MRKPTQKQMDVAVARRIREGWEWLTVAEYLPNKPAVLVLSPPHADKRRHTPAYATWFRWKSSQFVPHWAMTDQLANCPEYAQHNVPPHARKPLSVVLKELEAMHDMADGKRQLILKREAKGPGVFESRPDTAIRLKLSVWERRTGIKVLDPDGWRRTNTPLDKAVTFDEWTALWQASSVRVSKKGKKLDFRVPGNQTPPPIDDAKPVSGWASWDKADVAAELRQRMRHFYGQVDGTIRFPNSAEGDLLKMVHVLLSPCTDSVEISKMSKAHKKAYATKKLNPKLYGKL